MLSFYVAATMGATRCKSSETDGDGRSCVRFESDAALIQVAAVPSKCFHPRDASCLWYSNLNKKCCSAIADANHSFSKFCAECQGCANADVVSDVSALCTSADLPLEFVQLEQHQRGEVITPWLIRTLRFGARVRKSHRPAPVETACQHAEGDCSFNFTVQTGVTFKQLDVSCCSLLQDLFESADLKRSNAEFCAACAASTNQDVQGIVAAACETERKHGVEVTLPIR